MDLITLVDDGGEELFWGSGGAGRKKSFKDLLTLFLKGGRFGLKLGFSKISKKHNQQIAELVGHFRQIIGPAPMGPQKNFEIFFFGALLGARRRFRRTMI